MDGLEEGHLGGVGLGVEGGQGKPELVCVVWRAGRLKEAQVCVFVMEERNDKLIWADGNWKTLGLGVSFEWLWKPCVL